MVAGIFGAVLLLTGSPAPASSLALSPSAVPGDSVMLGVRVTPDTVTIGAPFRVVVRIRAPRGSRIEFASGPDSTGSVQALDSRVVTDAPDTTATDATATYRLAAWDVGRLAIGIPDAVVRLRGGVDRPVSLGGLTVAVRRTTAPKAPPRPARAILPAPVPWWWPWAIAAGVLLVLLLIIGLASRRRRRPPPIQALDPYGNALGEFERIDRLGLIEAGERGRFVALVAQVMRDYLASRIASAELSLTTGELLHALVADSRVPLDRLRDVLDASDLVKFAHGQVTSERAAEVGHDARGVVDAVDAAATAAQAAHAAKVA